MSGHRTLEKRKADSGKNRSVASSFRRETSDASRGADPLAAAKALDARREATIRGLMNATVAAIRQENVTDMGDGQPFPNVVVIDGGLRSHVAEEPVVDEPIEGFSSQAEAHEPVGDPDAYTVFCSRKVHTEAQKLLDKRGGTK